MIVLHTGLPGHGKTLLTIQRIKQIAEADPDNVRPVYYNGITITDFDALPWHHLDDPIKWFECPPNAIILIDEAQRIFRPRGPSSPVPEHVSRLETHRHGGVDLHLITQRPKLIDAHVRELAGGHFHTVRKFGMARAVVHEWIECQDNTKLRKDSIRHEVKYPKEIYGWYKSAEVHTHKRSIPIKYWLMWTMPVLAIALGSYGAYRLVNIGKTKTVEEASVGSLSLPGVVPANAHGPVAKQTVSEWLQDRTPRIPDLAYSAAVYDEVTKPTVAPYPAACVTIRSECRCWTQQGTRLAVSAAMCQQVVERGFFVDWEPNKAQGQGVATGQQRDNFQPSQVHAAADPARGFKIDYQHVPQALSSSKAK